MASCMALYAVAFLSSSLCYLSVDTDQTPPRPDSTYHAHPVFGPTSVSSKTTISFALQDFSPFHIDDTEKTTSWQPLHGESQRQNEEGGRSPTHDMGRQFATRGRPKVRTAGGGFENKSQEGIVVAGYVASPRQPRPPSSDIMLTESLYRASLMRPLHAHLRRA